MSLKKITAGAAMVGALGLGSLGASSLAQAKPHDPVPPPIPPIPGPGHGSGVWEPGDPPGHNPFGPPGQVKKDPVINGVPNPFYGVPPGHWDDPALFGVPVVWLPPGVPDVPGPLPVVWNPDVLAWGVWWVDRFIPIPL